MGVLGKARSLARTGVDAALFVGRRVRRESRPTYVPGTPPPPLDADAWTWLRQHRVFFGHQSVGENILQGLTDLAAAAGELPPRIVSLDGRDLADLGDVGDLREPGFIADAHLGANGDPASKMADFARYLRGGVAAQVDVALMKLCYVDMGRRSRPAELFAAYAALAEELAAEFPTLLLMHATIPLTTGATLPNVLRTEYNALLRARFPAEHLVDIAALETADPSDAPAGPLARLARERLASALTSDGGHLNEAGRRRVAEGLLATLGAATHPAS